MRRGYRGGFISGGFVGGGFVSGPVYGGAAYGGHMGYGGCYGHHSQPMGFYGGWHGFHSHWAGYMDWMDQGDYMIWHGWQHMLGGSSMGYSEQWSLLEGLLQQDHGDINRREIKELTDQIMKMNKELGAGDDGRVQEVIEESSTTTTTTTTSTVTQQQRYDTANAFLHLLGRSSMGFTVEQAQTRVNEIRKGRRDAFVTNFLE